MTSFVHSGFVRADAGFSLQAVCPQAVEGRFIAAVGGDGPGLKIESTYPLFPVGSSSEKVTEILPPPAFST